MFMIMGLLSGLAAFGLLGGAVWAYFKQRRQMGGRVATTGSVVELASRVMNPGQPAILCPVVEFNAPSGEKIRFTSDFGSMPASHKVGQTVNVRYDPADPHKAEIDSAENLWIIPLILIFMGAIACCLAVAFLGVYALTSSAFQS